MFMEISSAIQPSSILPFLLFLLMIIIKLINTRRKSQAQYSVNDDEKLPPGPLKLPIIGNMHHLLCSLPHHALANLGNKYGPLMHLQLGEVSTVVVSSPEIAKQVMKTHDIIFSSRPIIPSQNIITYNNEGIGAAPYGEQWRQLRKICIVEVLSLKRVQSYAPLRERMVSHTVESIRASSSSSSSSEVIINLSKLIYSTTIGIVMRTVFGERCKYKEEFIDLVKRTTEVVGGLSLADVFPSRKYVFVVTGSKYRCEKVHGEMDKILNDIIEEHRSRRRFGGDDDENENEEEDLVDVLLNVQESGDLQFPLTTNNIKGVIQDIFVAGSDTSSTTVEWAMSELLRNPTIMTKAQVEVRQVFEKYGKVKDAGLHELKYMKSVIKETLRVHPPLPLLVPRESMDKCDISGYSIPSKTQVIVNAWALGRDPNHWDEPDKFCPDRFLENLVDYKGNHFEFIPFGAGRRICPGIPFGLANAELLLAELLYHFDWKLPNGMKPNDLDMREMYGIVVRRKNELYLTPMPYVN